MFKGLTGLLKSRLPESVPDSGSLDASVLNGCQFRGTCKSHPLHLGRR